MLSPRLLRSAHGERLLHGAAALGPDLPVPVPDLHRHLHVGLPATSRHIVVIFRV